MGFFTIVWHNVFFVFAEPSLADKIAIVVISGEEKHKMVVYLIFRIFRYMGRVNHSLKQLVFLDFFPAVFLKSFLLRRVRVQPSLDNVFPGQFFHLILGLSDLFICQCLELGFNGIDQ
ncbi:MAG: hypothetical protein M0Z56_12750 [Desulfobacteraceae bacterium]|nr:hypothetical protein [Desulfobacteraceae bacterium]